MLFRAIPSMIVIASLLQFLLPYVAANRLLQAITSDCTLPAEPGMCMAAFLRYYYDTTTQSCQTFTWGGCAGNGNNFLSLDDCNQQCTPSVVDPSTTAIPVVDVCSLPSRTGPCRASFTRWYYDSGNDRCRQFTYGGCKGNENNFLSKASCVSQCDPVDICSLPSRAGPCEAAMTRYHYNSNTQTCDEFFYGGCQGNDNNFWTVAECEAACMPPFDWSAALADLESRKTAWQSLGIVQYEYNFAKLCFCMQCDVAGKYIEVLDGIVTSVQFDEYADGCGTTHLYLPLDQNYDTIVDLFDKAIAHVTQGRDANCNGPANQFPDMICDGGIQVLYDPVLGYPTYINLVYGPLVADAGASYTVRCLTAINVAPEATQTPTMLSGYSNECTPPTTTTEGPCNKQIQETCTLNDACCDGFCGTSRLDGSSSVCCYHDKYQDIVCESDADCCFGYECDANRLCVAI